MSRRRDGAAAVSTAVCVGHTETPALAGIASTVANPPSTAGGTTTRRYTGALRGGRDALTGRRRRRLGTATALVAALALGGAVVPSLPAGASASQSQSNLVTAHGAPILGSPPADLEKPAVGIASTPSHRGYWIVASDGGVFSFGDATFYGSAGDVALRRPIVAMVPTPTGHGYWLAANDGGVFSFGDAPFLGSLAEHPLAAPITSIAATPSGDGYWLVGSDGGVFAFGDARYFGSTGTLHLAAPVVGMTRTADGDGYYLASSDGGVFAFGNAPFRGADVDAQAAPAVGIASSPTADGYAIVRADGHVFAYGMPYQGDAAFLNGPPAIGIATGVQGYWIAHGATLPAAPTIDLSQNAFLACTRRHESDTSGGYHAVSRSGIYRGAYQFDRSTWDNTARRAGRLDLVGVDPAAASPADQDFLAFELHSWAGAAPWGGRCGGM
jgi:hypothetical protein